MKTVQIEVIKPHTTVWVLLPNGTIQQGCVRDVSVRNDLHVAYWTDMVGSRSCWLWVDGENIRFTKRAAQAEVNRRNKEAQL